MKQIYVYKEYLDFRYFFAYPSKGQNDFLLPPEYLARVLIHQMAAGVDDIFQCVYDPLSLCTDNFFKRFFCFIFLRFNKRKLFLKYSCRNFENCTWVPRKNPLRQSPSSCPLSDRDSFGRRWKHRPPINISERDYNKRVNFHQ